MEVYEEVLAAIQELEVEFKNTQIMAQNIGQCLPKLHALAQDLKLIKFFITDLRYTAAAACTNPPFRPIYIATKDNKDSNT